MILLFGGSFDPVHIGHLIIARDVKEKTGADKVVFIPTHRTPLKESHSAPPEDRLNMVRLAVEGEEGFEVEDYEVRRGGISYTVETLKYLADKLPGKPVLLLGADSMLRFHLWRDPERIIDMADLMVVEREGLMEKVREYVRTRFPMLKEGKNVFFVSTRRIDVSATEIRRRVKEGKSIYCLVPEPVERYIKERGLYR
ncbi:MAG: nicotinate (nicotinamide) nucleotide adenylyltransferase [Aquificota bacterium]|nr:nicotinate (nicotinamide) nucleotide adenylyltransferase [Aquificota bacterium]